MTCEILKGVRLFIVTLVLFSSSLISWPVTDEISEKLDVCLNGIHHKKVPSREDALYECDSWKDWSCCTNDTAARISHNIEALYGFNYSHCRNMSKKCFNRFVENSCFYECSPNVGLWLIPQVKSKIRKERMKNVPLCQHQCDDWWEDCKTEQTCIENWSTGFEWSNETNHCPVNETCQSFNNIFHNATYFCEHVFGPNDYKVISDASHCMKFSFKGENPNTQVAKYYATLVHSPSSTQPATVENIPSYSPPTPIPPLQVNGTTASIVIAILILVVVFCVVVYVGVKYFRKIRFHHQGAPVQFRNIVPSRIVRRITSVSVGQDDRDAEMSFMQYDEEDEDEDDMEVGDAL